MAVIHKHSATPVTTATTTDSSGVRLTDTAARAVAVLRIGFGLTFLWAFADKLFALGFHTGYDQTGTLDRFGDAAWINGGSPTEGFLTFGADGPFKSFYNNIAGAAWADTLFMLALLGIGLALTLGVAMRLAAGSGALLYVMMWTVVLPPENNPVIDDHLLSAITLVVLALVGAGATWGLGARLEKTEMLRRFPVLR